MPDTTRDPLAHDDEGLRAAGYIKPPHGWTCFHCGETFATVGGARDHFGFDCSHDPACRIKAGEERGLVMALRRSEAEVARLVSDLHNENTEALKHLRRVQSQIGEHARAAEQSGYDRALRDVEAGKVEDDHAMRIVAAFRDILARHGLAVVPVEATEAMLFAAISRPQPDPELVMYPAIWRAMLAVAQEPPQDG